MVAYIFSQSQHLGDKGWRLRNWRPSIFINSKFEARLGYRRWSQNHWWGTDLAIFKLPWKLYKLVIGSYSSICMGLISGLASNPLLRCLQSSHWSLASFLYLCFYAILLIFIALFLHAMPTYLQFSHLNHLYFSDFHFFNYYLWVYFNIHQRKFLFFDLCYFLL